MGVKHHFRKPPYGTLESNGFTKPNGFVSNPRSLCTRHGWLWSTWRNWEIFPIQIEGNMRQTSYMEHQRFEVKKVAHSEIIEKTGWCIYSATTIWSCWTKMGCFRIRKALNNQKLESREWMIWAFRIKKDFVSMLCIHSKHFWIQILIGIPVFIFYPDGSLQLQ